MGLDIVEIIMEVEDTFEICIPNEDWAQIPTVGSLHEYILQQRCEQRRRFAANPTCPSLSAFIATRKAIVSVTGVERQSVRPTTNLSLLLPRRRRRSQWRKIAEAAHIRLPRLELPTS